MTTTVEAPNLGRCLDSQGSATYEFFDFSASDPMDFLNTAYRANFWLWAALALLVSFYLVVTGDGWSAILTGMIAGSFIIAALRIHSHEPSPSEIGLSSVAGQIGRVMALLIAARILATTDGFEVPFWVIALVICTALSNAAIAYALWRMVIDRPAVAE